MSPSEKRWTLAYPIPADGTVDVRREATREQFTVRMKEGRALAQMLNDYAAALESLSQCQVAYGKLFNENAALLGRLDGASTSQAAALEGKPTE